jgi:heme/copper-type cytochrome/quinol oxidase subunit 2
MTEKLRNVSVMLFTALAKMRDDDHGFQTAEAIAIAAVGIIVLAAILAVLQVLGVDVINWLRDQFGIPSSG